MFKQYKYNNTWIRICQEFFKNIFKFFLSAWNRESERRRQDLNLHKTGLQPVAFAVPPPRLVKEIRSLKAPGRSWTCALWFVAKSSIHWATRANLPFNYIVFVFSFPWIGFSIKDENDLVQLIFYFKSPRQDSNPRSSALEEQCLSRLDYKGEVKTILDRDGFSRVTRQAN